MQKVFWLGVRHIAEGTDHLLFLLALLLSAARTSLWNIVKAVSGFTLGHSLTLAIGAFGLVSVPSRWVEILIALSIIVVCAENLLRQNAPADRFWLAGGFGLIHGFGFAGALRETGLGESGASVAVPLASFNLGVEAGQLIVVAIVLPLLFLMRRWRVFELHGARAISIAVIAVSGYWFLQRTLWFR